MLVNIPGTKLVRDTKSMALSNTDSTEKNEYLTKAKLLKTQKDEINNIKAEMKEIKDLMKLILEKING
jgi:hypothetical protein